MAISECLQGSAFAALLVSASLQCKKLAGIYMSLVFIGM